MHPSSSSDHKVWSEAEYVDYLESERRRYAWVIRRYGGLRQAEAQAAALARYPYEPDDAPFRGLVFHDEAWHWAMLAVHGDQYWQKLPELAQPPAVYRALE